MFILLNGERMLDCKGCDRYDGFAGCLNDELPCTRNETSAIAPSKEQSRVDPSYMQDDARVRKISARNAALAEKGIARRQRELSRELEEERREEDYWERGARHLVEDGAKVVVHVYEDFVARVVGGMADGEHVESDNSLDLQPGHDYEVFIDSDWRSDTMTVRRSLGVTDLGVVIRA